MKYLKIYKHHGGGLKGLKQVFNTFIEVDIFDLLNRGVNTRTIKTDGYQNRQYMWYSPVYTTVSLEMIRMSIDFFNSAIRYTDFERKIIFIDLGCGAGKTIIQADDTNFFNYCGGVELDSELKDLCDRNLSTAYSRKKVLVGGKKPFTILGNVEESNWAIKLKELINKDNVLQENVTLFVFNKNSYDGPVLEASLRVIKQFFDSVIYLYQNPIHHKYLIRNNYECFLEDSKPNNAHKNYKYKCYFRHNL